MKGHISQEPKRYIGGHIPATTYDKIQELAKEADRPAIYILNKLINRGLRK